MMQTTVTVAVLDSAGEARTKATLTGARVGPFIVHPQKQWRGHYALAARGYSVTHIATGFTACPDIPDKASAMHAARRFLDLDVDWEFSDPSAPKAWPDLVIKQVLVIRAAARAGCEA